MHPYFPWKVLEGSVVVEPLLDQAASAWVFLMNGLRDICPMEAGTEQSDQGSC